MIIQYEKTFQGAHKFYTLVDNELISMQYMFCNKATALKQFKQFIKDMERV